MTILQIYVSDEDMATLRMVALERECASSDLAEAAVSEACLAVRKGEHSRQALAQLNLAGIDRALVPVTEAMQPPVSAVDAGIASPDRPRCDGGQVGGLGECLVCDAEQGEACRMPSTL